MTRPASTAVSFRRVQCDDDAMDRADLDDAVRRIVGHVRRTPLQPVEPGDPWLPGGGCLKLELLQHTGTFKPRGAFNRILAAEERGELDPSVGIVVASGGNAGLANAYAAREIGVPATVFVPTTSSPTKLRRLAEYGATIVQQGTEYAEAAAAAVEHVERTGAVACHAYDQIVVCAGAGPLGLVLLDQLAEGGRGVDTVVVAVGGGGLMAGVATAVEGRARVVGVEPALAPTLHRALDAGEPVDVTVAGVAADSLGARRLGSIAWDVARRTGVTSVLVDDEAILRARQQVWDRYRIVLETGAAAPVAALLSGAYRPADGERVAVVLCGANTDPSDLG
jgi:threonine dehydratase